MIPELLQRWAKKQPEVCQVETNEDGDIYKIGEYSFWDNLEGGISACHDATYKLVTSQESYNVIDFTGLFYRGQPALDWLEGCVRRCIEAQELDYEHRYISQIGIAIPKHKVTIFNLKRSILRDDKIMAFLTAYVEYLETQG